jgi:hypothetical protein
LKRLWLGVLPIALLACRGIIGIEPLELSDSGMDASAGGDATSHDASTDAGGGPDTAGPADGGDPYAQCATQGGGCRPCCHTNFASAFNALPLYLRDAGCICGTGQCSDVATGCAQQTCANPPQPPQPPCGPCIDTIMLQKPLAGSCDKGATDCMNDPTCKQAVECLRACAP